MRNNKMYNSLRAWLLALLCLPALVVAATDISREDLARLAGGAAGKPVLVDVRSAAEYAAGHIPGAINIPHDQLATRAGELAAHRQDGTLVLYCRSGRRAGLAAETLEAQGFKGLKHLAGDFQGWEQAGQPLER